MRQLKAAAAIAIEPNSGTVGLGLGTQPQATHVAVTAAATPP
jgi:hypothetical protein